VNPEMAWLDPAVLTTAFLAGLLGSGHCFGMCGGIAAGLGAMARGRAVIPALQFNLARLLSYAVLGLIAAWRKWVRSSARSPTSSVIWRS